MRVLDLGPYAVKGRAGVRAPGRLNPVGFELLQGLLHVIDPWGKPAPRYRWPFLRFSSQRRCGCVARPARYNDCHRGSVNAKGNPLDGGDRPSTPKARSSTDPRLGIDVAPKMHLQHTSRTLHGARDVAFTGHVIGQEDGSGAEPPF